MADFAPRDVQRGIADGVTYAQQFGLEVPQEALVDRFGVLEATLSSWKEDLSERFVSLFAMNYTVASIARIYYNDEPLTEEEMESFLGGAVAFFNSWRHR